VSSSVAPLGSSSELLSLSADSDSDSEPSLDFSAEEASVGEFCPFASSVCAASDSEESVASWACEDFDSEESVSASPFSEESASDESACEESASDESSCVESWDFCSPSP